MLRWLRKKHQHDPDDLVEERWETSFSRFSRSRFPAEESGDGYSSREEPGALTLSLERPNIFAWITDPFYRYQDLLLEADIRFDSENGYSSAGFLFRYIEDGGYYYFLVSNRGHFRFDLVFNEKPQTLIPWTPAPLPQDGHLYVRIIAHDTSFVFTVNEQWVGEFSDENLESGRIAFAGQNYEESPRAAFRLERLRVDSLPFDVESAYYRWNRALPPLREQRISLAESLHAAGHFSPAAVQLKKAFARGDKPSPEEYFLLAECCVQLGLYREALEAVEHSLQQKPDFPEALVEKANLLYMQNRFLELRDFLKPVVEEFPSDSLIWNLLGHGEFGVGNWKNAAEAYRAAAGINSEMPLFFVNAARAWERAGEGDEALKDYLSAARLYFRQEDYYDLEGLLPAIQELSSDNPEVRALEGKVLFGRGEYGDADAVFRELLDSGYSDGAVLFLHGMVMITDGRRDMAAEYLLQAAEKEPDYYLFWLRLADNLHALGLDAFEEAEKALALAPDDPWVLNLAGLLYAESGDFPKSRELLSRAASAAPGEEEIQANTAYLISREEGLDAGIAYLDSLDESFADSHVLINQRANFLVARGDFDGAVALYEKSVRLDPENIDYRMNCAAACLKVDMITRAEELYQDVLERREDPSAMIGIGNCAWVKSEFLRAETAYSEALKLQPDHADAHCNLVELLLTVRKFDEAREALAAARQTLADPPDRLEGLAERLRKVTEDSYSCASCGREWHEPKSSEPVPPLRLHGEPPGHAPAGKCEKCGRVYCVACASERVRDSRLVCECGGALKLNEAPLRRIMLREIEHP